MTALGRSSRMARPLLVAIAVLVLLGAAGLGLWAATDSPTATPEQQVMTIAASLRCPTCQGLSVADSAAPIAVSMREIITEQVAEGRTPEEIRGYFVARYSEWILLSPSTDGLGWLVWGLPVMAVLGGAGVAVSFTRRRPTAVSAADRMHASELVTLHGEGRLALPQTPAGERLDAALDLATEVVEGGDATSDAHHAALTRVAAAIAAQRRGSTAPTTVARRGRAAIVGTSVRGDAPVRRRLAWAGGTVAFGVFVTGLLAINLAPRGDGELPTGNLPVAAPAGPNATAEIDALRAAVDQDPSDLPARLDLAAQLIQVGDSGGARTQARAVLDQAPDHPDGLLLLGLALTTDGSPVAPQTLQRFLDAAPADHPGISLARSLLESQ